MRNYFNTETDTLNKGKFIVTLRIIVYRQKLGKYPSFLKDFDTPDSIRDGYTTKFWYLCKDENGNDLENLSLEKAEQIANELEEKYANILRECENTGEWKDFSLDGYTLIYHK